MVSKDWKGQAGGRSSLRISILFIYRDRMVSKASKQVPREVQAMKLRLEKNFLTLITKITK